MYVFSIESERILYIKRVKENIWGSCLFLSISEFLRQYISAANTHIHTRVHSFIAIRRFPLNSLFGVRALFLFRQRLSLIRVCLHLCVSRYFDG